MRPLRGSRRTVKLAAQAPAPRELPIDTAPQEVQEDWIEVFAAPRAADCKERALVLRAQDIPFARHRSNRLHALWVPASYEEAALAELSSYERENRDWPPPRELPRGHGRLGWGVAGYALAISLPWVLESLAPDLPWRPTGVAAAEAIRAGELWRAATALTLHSGPVHLLSNLVFGSIFGVLVAWSHGSGRAWLAILVAGFLGNTANAWIQDPSHASLGASTAVFGAVGLLAGSEWRRRHLLRERRLRVAAPIVMGLLLLAFHGVPEDPAGVDVLAHVLGLGFGVLLGPLLAHLASSDGARTRSQLAPGLLALGLLGLAWALALGLGTGPGT